MPLLLLVLIAAVPADAAAPHSGEVARNGFALSDVALFAFAAIGIWLAQRSMRRRTRKRAED